MPESNLLEQVWSQARSAIGTTVRHDLGSIRELDLARFDAAVCGSAADDISGLAAPLYLSSVLAWGGGPAERDLLPDGNAPDPFSGVDLAGLRLMGGGQELRFHRDPNPGVPMWVEVTVADVELKSATAGLLLVLTLDRKYQDADGLLVECREKFLGREEA